MYRKLFAALFLLGVVSLNNAWAHDPSKHKGKATIGEVASIGNDRLELKTSTGTKTIMITEITKFERGNEKIAKEELKVGDKVTLFGTTLATGEIVAREILLTKSEVRNGNSKRSGQEH
jgi:Domain of unknown function (DUF5666)